MGAQRAGRTGRRRAERLGGALLALGLSLGLSLAAAEWALRLYPLHGLTLRPDDRTLLALIPGSRSIFVRDAQNGGQHIPLRVDAQGFRGPDVGEKRGPRVAVYGDSFVYAEFSRLEDTFAQRLGARLSAALGPVEVVNAGVVSYGPDQESLRVEDELGALRPDLLVLCLYAGNDWGDLLRNKLFRIDESGKLVRNGAVLDPGLRRDLDPTHWRNRFALVRNLRFLAWVARSRIAGDDRPVTIDDWLRQSIAEYRDTVLRRDPVVTNLLDDHYDADLALEPDSPSARYKRRLMEGVLGRIGGLARAHGVPLLLVLIPDPIDASDGYDWQVDVAAHPAYRRSTLTDALAKIAQRQGLAAVNLWEPFRAAGADSLYFHFGDDHWNDAGQDLAARVVARRILADPALRMAR